MTWGPRVAWRWLNAALAVVGTAFALFAFLASTTDAHDDMSPNTSMRLVVPQIAADGVAPPPPPIPTPPPSGPTAYFTFDDGPNPVWTSQVLQVLARFNAKATFFVVGGYVDAYGDLIAAEAAAGHAIGVHGYDHVALTGLGAAAITDQLVRGTGAIARVTGRGSTCMRPPYGAVNTVVRTAAAAQGLAVWMWTVDPRDWSGLSSDEIASHILAYVKPGSVVLLHDGGGDRSRTVAALERVIPALSTRGYQFLPLPC